MERFLLSALACLCQFGAMARDWFLETVTASSLPDVCDRQWMSKKKEKRSGKSTQSVRKAITGNKVNCRIVHISKHTHFCKEL